MRAILTAVSTLVIALGVLGIAIAAPHIGGRSEPQPLLAASTGALTISNSEDGEALFSTGPMRPGGTVTGDVRIGNAGESEGRFSVRFTGIQDTPGPYGGKLSERVNFALFEVTTTPVTLFSGSATELGDLDLGTVAPGQRRDYRIVATFPDGGLPASPTTGDNAFQGSSLSLDVEWNAVATGDGGDTGGDGGNTGGGDGGGDGGNTGGNGGDTGGGDTDGGGVLGEGGAGGVTGPGSGELEVAGEALGLPSARRCVNRSAMKLRIRAPKGLRLKRAVVKVNGKTKRIVRRVKTVKVRKLPAKRFTLVVKVRATNGRVFKTKRVYKVCDTKAVRKVKTKSKNKRLGKFKPAL